MPRRARLYAVGSALSLAATAYSVLGVQMTGAFYAATGNPGNKLGAELWTLGFLVFAAASLVFGWLAWRNRTAA